MAKMGTDQERHRPGLLKQQNKAHKHGRHRSKGAVHMAEKGKSGVKVITKKFKTCNSRKERRNQMVQNRLKKRQEALQKKRQLGSPKAPPFLIAVVPLNFYADTQKLMNFMRNCDENLNIMKSPEGIVHVRLKQRFSFITPQKGNIYATLDCLKVVDTVLFVVSAVAEPIIDAVSEHTLTAVLAQGLPSTVVTAVDLENIPVKKRQNVKQDMQKLISQWLPEEKIMTVDKEIDGLNLLRRIGSQKQRSVSQRDRRPHLLAEQLEFISNENSSVGVLKVSGYLRGQMLSVNSLIHIPGWGDFQMKQIDGLDSQFSMQSADDMKSGTKVLEVADPNKQESLVSENIPDPMDAEQTWPTEEELRDAKEERKQQKLIKRIPKGVSEYQACWIPDEETEVIDVDSEDDDDLEVEKPMDYSDDESEKRVRFNDEEQCDIVSVTEGEVDAEKYDSSMDLDEEKEAREKIRGAKMDQMFPDEVDTPQDVPARERFQKYRGLSSFRTSPWDPKENLPCDYARIFQFENFNRTRKRIFSQLENERIDGIAPGTYITIHIDKVPVELYFSRNRREPIVVFGMLEHEQKMSVVNFVLKRCQNTPWADIPIQSKEELLFQCGYRRYKGRPVFSEHTNGDKHKYQRYFQPGSVTVCTLFAPIIFPPASVLVFKENPDGTQDVIATGSVLSVNPDRLIIKRVVLSGHPFKVNKKSAVIRFMFFNRDDINWFKPVELRTKYGRRGHIREPLGTHGHMKTVFDGQLKSQDTVLMFLYKRVFPKWTYDPVVRYTNSRYKNLPKIPEENGEEMEQ